MTEATIPWSFVIVAVRIADGRIFADASSRKLPATLRHSIEAETWHAQMKEVDQVVASSSAHQPIANAAGNDLKSLPKRVNNGCLHFQSVGRAVYQQQAEVTKTTARKRACVCETPPTTSCSQGFISCMNVRRWLKLQSRHGPHEPDQIRNKYPSSNEFGAA